MSNSTDFTLQAVEAAKPLVFNQAKCTGCNLCVEVCPNDLLLPGQLPGDFPIVAYPDECWYCGCCVMECPNQALTLQHPLMNRARWIKKADLLNNKMEDK